jgi:hypothetical protein
MMVVREGWIGTGDDEAMEAREILGRSLLPDLGDERRQLEQRRAAETAAGDREDESLFRAWTGCIRSEGDVLAGAADPVDRAHRSRVHRARELLAREGLSDLLPGGAGAGLMDPNVGFVPVAGPRMTRDEGMERATIARDRRERQAREAMGLDAIARSREARGADSWAARMSAFIAGR